MDAPYYNGEPGARPYDEDWDERAAPEAAATYVCSDCGDHGEAHFHVILTTGATYCDPCFRYRAKHGWEFDTRSIQALTTQGAA